MTIRLFSSIAGKIDWLGKGSRRKPDPETGNKTVVGKDRSETGSGIVKCHVEFGGGKVMFFAVQVMKQVSRCGRAEGDGCT